MAYKCRNCGKFVAKNATVCKYCGLKSPLSYDTSESANMSLEKENKTKDLQTQIYCPSCGSVLMIPKNLKNEKYLRCNICNKDFVNPLITTNNQRWIEGETMGYSNRIWRYTGIIFLGIVLFYLLSTIEQKESQKQVYPLQKEQYELVVINGEAIQSKALSKSDYEIIHKWKESNMGINAQECRLERIKKDGSYRILIGGIYFSCEPRVIKNGSNIFFYNPNIKDGGYFHLSNETPIYFIPQMENNGTMQIDGILVIQADKTAQVYMNDNGNSHFEIFTELQPIM